jgi:hypothetical protein
MRASDSLVLNAVSGARPSSTGWVRGTCCWCEERVGKVDRKKCLGLSLTTGKWRCFRCGAEGRVLALPGDLRDLAPDVLEAREAAAAMDPPDGFWPLFEEPGLSSASLAAARRYLTAPRGEGGRGLDPDVLRDAGVGACVTGRYGGRIVVPVTGRDETTGEDIWYGWSSRPWVKDSSLGYLYPRGMPLAELIYNPGFLRVETDVPGLVVEGVFDAHAFWPDAGATLGGTREPHLVALAEARRPIVFVPDGDAWSAGWKNAMRLRFEGVRAGAVRLPPRVDPDEVPAADIWRAAEMSLDREIVVL